MSKRRKGQSKYKGSLSMSGRSFAEYLHQTDPTQLSPADRAYLRKDDEWADANLQKAMQLDAMIGCMVELTKSRKAINGAVYPMGMRFTVVDRWLDVLIVYSHIENVRLVVKPDWIQGCEEEDQEGKDQAAAAHRSAGRAR